MITFSELRLIADEVSEQASPDDLLKFISIIVNRVGSFEFAGDLQLELDSLITEQNRIKHDE